MPRVKRSVHARKKRRKVLAQAKGYWGLKHSSYRRAKEQVEHSLVYAYRDRKAKKRTFRRLWIVRINAAARRPPLSRPLGRGVVGRRAGRARRAARLPQPLHRRAAGPDERGAALVDAAAVLPLRGGADGRGDLRPDRARLERGAEPRLG